ncbi:MAG: LytS/YhcK type 5TM receptor domain-containing protein [Lachnospiraceae bacterium]|nr:LytS/YhcK type 5TM receptor domain-containing protein [Lachnospiraceae bacterium]
MSLSLFGSLIINISLLVLIATILTKVPFVKSVISEEHRSQFADRLSLGIIFGLFCIFSTCTGVHVDGAIQNTRVLGVLAGGLLGGPTVGITAAIIGAIHRFLYDTQSITSVSCTISTLFEGVLASGIWIFCKKKNLKLNALALFTITAFAEACQMLIILAIARPFAEALTMVKIIAAPMILTNSCGMLLFFSVFREVFTKQDLLAADQIRLALIIADQSLPYIQKTTITTEGFQKISENIQRISSCTGVIFLAPDKKTALNDTNLQVPEELLAHMGESDNYCFVNTKRGLNVDKIGKHMAIGAPLTRGNEIWSYLVLFFPRHVESVELEVTFVEGLAKFFSTNYELSQIEHQKKLREQAEFRALQSQINPHFLFNSLNTITYFCREKPDKARELLLALSIYFRHTLNSSNAYMIALEQELEHVKAYLMLEEARFEDRLHVEISMPEQLEIEVPTLILQPIVENAVKHGAMKRESGVVQVKGVWESEDIIRIAVSDNGPGIPREVLQGFYDASTTGKFGMLNVDARLRSIYGDQFALHVDTDENGTTIIMRIPKQRILETQE